METAKLSDTLTAHLQRFYDIYKELPSLDHYYPTLFSPSIEKVQLRLRSMQAAQEYINFASSNYLRLSRRPEVRAAYLSAYEQYGCGANGSPVLSGYYQPHAELETDLAKFHGTQDTVLFSSGYCANLSTIAAFLGPKDMLIFDEASHGSLIDGGNLARTQLRSFPHNDPEALRKILQRLRPQAELVIVATLGVFSMSGDIAPLPELIQCTKEYDALFLLDDAHAVGVLGETGRGSIEHFGIDPSLVDFCVGTLSKTLGGIGGYVAARQELTDFLRYSARPHVLSASIPPTTAAGCLAAVRILDREGAELSAALRQKAEDFRARLRQHDLVLLGKNTGVAALSVPDFTQLWHAANYLFEQGIFLNPVLYPAVRKDEGRLRFYINVGHSDADLQQAADLTREALEKFSTMGEAH